MVKVDGNAVPTPPLKSVSVPTPEKNIGTLCNAVPTPPLENDTVSTHEKYRNSELYVNGTLC